MTPIDVKKETRRIVRAAIKSMHTAEKEKQSNDLCNAALNHSAVKRASVIALFAPLPDEPDIFPLIEELHKMCTVVLPRICGDEMDFYTYSPTAMRSGSYGISEPQGDTPVAANEIDVIIVPGVAFTRQGYRLGRGKGYYDRYMSQKGFRAYKIGVCYLQQIVETLPVETHDIRMDEMLCMCE